MARFRRTRFAFLGLRDDFSALLRGAPRGALRVDAFALLTGERVELTDAQFELLRTVPEHWVDAEPARAGELCALARLGLLVSDSDDAELAALRRRDEALGPAAWNHYAAIYHYMTRWSGVDIRADPDAELELGADERAAGAQWVAEHGPQPGPFRARHAGPAHALPDGRRDGELYRLLMARRSTRGFAPDTPLAEADLATVMRYVFGYHGTARNVAGSTLLKRTSPSGGALHVVEAYPLVSGVDGVDPGLYHYDVEHHRLVRLEALDAAGTRATATAFLAGQSFFGRAHVSFVLTARFDRSFWKYRHNQLAYAGILMDAAHLSQTLQLVCAELGIGCYITIGINARDIEARLGLDGVGEGAVAMLGCGPREPGRSPLELDFS